MPNLQKRRIRRPFKRLKGCLEKHLIDRQQRGQGA